MVGNDALLRCSVPGFAADLISVVGWTVFGHDGTDLVDVKHGEGGGRNLGKKGAETPRNRGLGCVVHNIDIPIHSHFLY